MNNVTPSRRTALVVEDHRATLDVLYDVLVAAGFKTTVSDHGRLAMTMLAEQCFDVLVVDVNLPSLNAMAIGNFAQERYQDQMVILVISGHPCKRRCVVSLQVGADAFLGKPFDPNELIARIESKLRRVPKG
jgi:DNA-binding response OmpR family regulator